MLEQLDDGCDAIPNAVFGSVCDPLVHVVDVADKLHPELPPFDSDIGKAVLNTRSVPLPVVSVKTSDAGGVNASEYDDTVIVAEAAAEGLPLLLTVAPVNTCVVDVPAVSVSVTVAV